MAKKKKSKKHNRGKIKNHELVRSDLYRPKVEEDKTKYKRKKKHKNRGIALGSSFWYPITLI